MNQNHMYTHMHMEYLCIYLWDFIKETSLSDSIICNFTPNEKGKLIKKQFKREMIKKDLGKR